MKARPIRDKAIMRRVVYAVADSHGNIDANRIYQPVHMDHALDLARALTAEKGETFLVIPIVLK